MILAADYGLALLPGENRRRGLRRVRSAAGSRAFPVHATHQSLSHCRFRRLSVHPPPVLCRSQPLIWLRFFASYSPVFKRLPASIPVPYSPPSSVFQSAFEWAAQPQVGVRKMNQHRSQVSKFRHHTCECFPAHCGIYRRRAAVFEGISSESHAWHQACSWVCGIWTR